MATQDPDQTDKTQTQMLMPPPKPRYFDARYEFCAPQFFDFIAGETAEEAAAAQLWLELAAPGLTPRHIPGLRSSVVINNVSGDAGLVKIKMNKESLQNENDGPSRSLASVEGSNSSGCVQLPSKTSDDASVVIAKVSSTSTDVGSNESAFVPENENVLTKGISSASIDVTSNGSASVPENEKVLKEGISTEHSCKRTPLESAGVSVISTVSQANSSNAARKSGVPSESKSTTKYVSPTSGASLEATDVEFASALSHFKSKSVSLSKVEDTGVEARDAEPGGASNGSNLSGQPVENDASKIGSSDVNDGSLQAPKDNTVSGSEVGDGIHFKKSRIPMSHFGSGGKPSSVNQKIEGQTYPPQLKRAASSLQATGQGHAKGKQQENKYPNKRQKLEGGLAKQMSNGKYLFPAMPSPSITVPEGFHFRTEERFVSHRGTHCQAFSQDGGFAQIPFAEQVLKFESGRNHYQQENHPLKLTRPKEPDLVTSHRVRPTRVKSSAELEEEMLANMPKFKARPLNKKILEAPSLPAPTRSTPQLPEFQEFCLRTAERATHHLANVPPNLESGSTSANICGSSFGAHNRGKRKTLGKIEEKRCTKKSKVTSAVKSNKKVPGLDCSQNGESVDKENTCILAKVAQVANKDGKPIPSTRGTPQSINASKHSRHQKKKRRPPLSDIRNRTECEDSNDVVRQASYLNGNGIGISSILLGDGEEQRKG